MKGLFRKPVVMLILGVIISYLFHDHLEPILGKILDPIKNMLSGNGSKSIDTAE